MDALQFGLQMVPLPTAFSVLQDGGYQNLRHQWICAGKKITLIPWQTVNSKILSIDYKAASLLQENENSQFVQD